MPTDIIMPKLGLTMEEGTVVRWLAREGEHVAQGAPLIEVETDKVIVEVEAPASGVIGAILVREGEKAPVGALLAHLFAAEEMETRKKEEGKRKIFSSPRARWRAAGLGVDWRTLAGSGPRGRIIERDVLAAGAGGTEGKRKKEEGRTDVPPAPATFKLRPPTFNLQPSIHLSAEVGAGALLEIRARLSPSIEKRAGVQLATTDLLIRICGAALARFPRANAIWENDRAFLQTQVNIGLTTAPGQAVIQDATRPLSQIASERAALLEREPREFPSAGGNPAFPSSFDGSAAAFLRPSILPAPGSLRPAAFTLLDLGMFRVDRVQATLSPPQTAILTVGRIAERPAVVEGHLAVRQAAFLTLSCDSRVFDAVFAAEFLDCIVDLIEEPYGLLI